MKSEPLPERDGGPGKASRVVLTGATGFLGHHVLAALLRAGVSCVALCRGPVARSRARLTRLLADLGVDAPGHEERGTLECLRSELGGTLPAGLRPPADALVHMAAATNFQTRPSGEPERTNVRGTRALLRWADRVGVRRLHLISSAYVCGCTVGPVPETFVERPSPFHNAYEHSKWESERLGVAWGARPGRSVTVYRPSIIVGAFDTGRATRFGGLYLSARATELVDRLYRDRPQREREAIDLRIIGRPLDRQNIVPVDYVAALIAAGVTAGKTPGLVLHVVHPDPPTQLDIKQAYERYFHVGGGRFVAPERCDPDDLTELERAFYDVTRPIRHYFIDTPVFRRDNAARLEASVGITCPTYDAAAIGRLVRYAQSHSWGRGGAARRSSAPGCAAYFERFLPSHVSRSAVARMSAVTATVRFVIEDEPEGNWVCRFDHGHLADVCRGANGVREDFGYRTTRGAFWDSISGRPHPQDLFLSGRAEMFGDIERALKMSMVLHAFTREFPCDPARLARSGFEA